MAQDCVCVPQSCAAAVIAAAVLGAHCVSMTMARIAPDPFPHAVQGVNPAALGYIVAGGVVILLMAVCTIALLQEGSVRSQVMHGQGFAN